MSEIDPSRLIVAGRSAYGIPYTGYEPAVAPVLHEDEINTYYAVFENLAAEESISATAWTSSPGGLTSTPFVPSSLVSVSGRTFRNARGITLSAPAVGTLYTLQCKITTDSGRELVCRFYVKGVD